MVSAAVLNEATPDELIAPVPMTLPPSRKLTLPVAGTPPAPETSEVKSTVWPEKSGLLLARMELLVACSTVSSKGLDWLAGCPASPA